VYDAARARVRAVVRGTNVDILFSLCPDDRLSPSPLRSFLRSFPSSLSLLSSSLGRASFGSTLHFGPDARGHNGFLHTHTEKSSVAGEDLSESFHTYGLEWGEEGLYTYLDNISNTVLAVNFSKTETFWQRGQKVSRYSAVIGCGCWWLLLVVGGCWWLFL
jgi:hypothetical protein